MGRPGLNIRGSSLSGVRILVIPFVIALAIYLFLKRMTTNTTAPEFYEKVKLAGFHSHLAKFITAQAAHETAIAGIPFMSPVYLIGNNAFGMKNAGQSLVTGELFGHATYNSVQDSIADYKKWYDRRTPWFNVLPYLVTISGFCTWLKKNKYFEAPLTEYTKGVEHFYNSIF